MTSEDTEAELRTFLIADVRGYTRFTQEFGDEAAATLATRFASVTREHVRQRGGRVVELRGDEALVVFASARRALRCAVELQAAFAAETERDPTIPLHVGIGVDAGEAVRVEAGYRGGALNFAARLCSHAAGGQVLASETVIHLAGKIATLDYIDQGLLRLKGLTNPVRAFEVRAQAHASHETPRSTESRREAGPPAPTVPAAELPLGGFLGARPERRFVAREEELRRIAADLDAVRAGSGRLVLISGEAGIGKTRLGQELSLVALSRDFVVATATCYEQREAVAYAPFLDALRSLREASGEAVPLARWPYLSRLLLDEDASQPPGPERSPEDRDRLFRAVTDYVKSMAAVSPVALLFDDLQWADASSLDLLQHLARETRASRVLVLGTYRDGEIGSHHPLQSVLLDLARQQLADSRQLPRLSAQETAALVAAALEGAEVSAEVLGLLYRRAEGNPFFTLEVLQALVERGDVYKRNDCWVGREVRELAVPARVRAVIGQRLCRLTSAGREVLREASVLGQSFSFDEVHRLSGRAEEDIEKALEEAVTVGIVREAGKDRYEFNHGLTRQTLYEELSGRRRARLHLAAGRALEQTAGGKGDRQAAELAWHFLQGNDVARALEHSERAGDQAEAALAHGEAERHYRSALELAGETGESARSAPLYQKLGNLLALTGRYDEALEMLERAARGFEGAGDVDDQRAAMARIGSVLGDLDRAQEGLARLEPLLPAPDTARASRGTALLYLALAGLYSAAGRYDESLAAAERAAHDGAAIGDQHVVVEAVLRRAGARGHQGRTDEARRLFQAALFLAHNMPYQEACILYEYGLLLTPLNAPEARARLDAALAAFRRLGAARDAEKARRALAELSGTNTVSRDGAPA